MEVFPGFLEICNINRRNTKLFYPLLFGFRYVAISMVSSMILRNYLKWEMMFQKLITYSWEILLIEDSTVLKRFYYC